MNRSLLFYCVYCFCLWSDHEVLGMNEVPARKSIWHCFVMQILFVNL